MTRHASLILSIATLALLIAGCSSLTNTPTSTPYPADYISTLIALTIEARHTATATPPATAMPSETALPSMTATQKALAVVVQDSPTPAQASATATIQPSATPTAGEDSPTVAPPSPTPQVQVADIQISKPGEMSKVVSPIHFVANVRTIPSGSYLIELYAEPLSPGGEPRRLFRELENITDSPLDWIYLDQDIQFEISRVSELAMLRVSVLDKDGRLAWVNSVDLILLSLGTSEITPKGDLGEPIIIQEPTPNHLIVGGTVIVSGWVRPSEDVLLMELVTSDGTVVGYNEAFITPRDDGGYVPFTVEVPYSLEKSIWVRLQVSESGVRIGGVEHMSSVEVYLSP